MKLNSDGEVCGLPEGGPLESALVQQFEVSEESGVSPDAMVRIVALCEAALKGELNGPSLKHYGPKRLNARALQMVLDSAMGSDMETLRERYGYATVGYVSLLLSHPDAVTIRAHIIGLRSDNFMDVNKRLELLATEALDVKVQLMRTGKQEVRNKASTEILAMAGYGERKKVDVQHNHSLALPAQAATGLANAFEELARIRAKRDNGAEPGYTKYLMKASEGGTEVGMASDLLPESEQLGAGSLPTAPPVPQAPEEERAVA